MQPSVVARKHLLAPLIALALLLVPGCLRVVLHESPYYVKSPHQVEPPDGYFSPGTNVMVFGEKDSYSRVLTFDGTAAYVWARSVGTLSEWRAERKHAEGDQWQE
jgi:hypothetical protein